MVDAEEAASFGEGYMNEADPSVLRFLIASREEVDSVQVGGRGGAGRGGAGRGGAGRDAVCSVVLLWTVLSAAWSALLRQAGAGRIAVAIKGAGERAAARRDCWPWAITISTVVQTLLGDRTLLRAATVAACCPQAEGNMDGHALMHSPCAPTPRMRNAAAG